MWKNELKCKAMNYYPQEHKILSTDQWDELHLGKSSFKTALDSKVMFFSFFIFYCYFDFILIFVLIFNSNQLLFQKTNKQ